MAIFGNFVVMPPARPLRSHILVFALASLGCRTRAPTESSEPLEGAESSEPSGPTELERSLAFEVEHPEGTPADWGGGPDGTIFVDGEVVHGGEWAARIERTADSDGAFTALTRTLPVEFGGERITLRGWLRTEDVEGHAGLWMREDGTGGSLEFDNMSDRAVSGTSEWTEYSVELPLDERAQELFIGALLDGTGKVWIDDLELLVDGVPVEQAPALVREPTILDTDTEFAEGSGVELSVASPTQIESLVVLAKVWGFLKYHHPRVTAGELHWDFELFRVLPSVLAAKTVDERNSAILTWIDGFGDVPACKPCASEPVDVHLQPPIDWIHDQALLGPALVSVLEQVHRNRSVDEQFWITKQHGVGNANFSRELAYAKLERLDPGYRLLAAFRIWNIIEYWFPYRDLIDEPWDGVLRELLPEFIAAAEREDYRRALLLLIARVHDTHANIWSALDSRPPVGECGLAADIRFLADEAVITAAHPGTEEGGERGLERGDVLVELGGESIEDLVERWSPYYAASNQPTRLRDIARDLTRGPCGPISAKVERGRKTVELELERVESWESHLRRWHDRPGETFQMLGPDVAYLKLSTIETEDIRAHVDAALGKRGLVIDIRNYPSAFTVFDLGQHLVELTRTGFARFTEPELANPGAFGWTAVMGIAPKRPRYEGKIVILVDELSQSSAEYTAMAFRAAPGAIVVGSTTAAADGNVSAIPLPGGERTMISGIGVFYPDKRPTQRVGIVPDIEVRPTREGVAAGRDEVLERALREILGPKVKAAKLRELAALPTRAAEARE